MPNPKPVITTSKRIYIAGPYTRGDVAANVRKAIQIADYIAGRGFVPFIPHLSHFWHLVYPHPYEFWLKYDLEWLKACDALVRIAGSSSGADGEVIEAQGLRLPVCVIAGIDGNSLNTLDSFLDLLEVGNGLERVRPPL